MKNVRIDMVLIVPGVRRLLSALMRSAICDLFPGAFQTPGMALVLRNVSSKIVE